MHVFGKITQKGERYINIITVFCTVFYLINMFKQFIVIILYVLSANVLVAQKYPAKSGLIVYSLSGIKSGTEINYFDEYGALASCLQIFNNVSADFDSINTILNHDTIVVLNVSTHVGNYSCLFDCFNKNKQNIISDSTLSILGYKNVGNESIIGIECDKYMSDNGKIWVWHNFVIKSEMEIMGTKLLKEAVKISINIDVPENEFDIPKYYTFKN